MPTKRKLHSSNTFHTNIDQRYERSLYDNGFNVSNHVPPQIVLRYKLHDSFPILYLPEYMERRIDDRSLYLGDKHENFDELLNAYRSYIGSSKKKSSKKKSTSDISPNKNDKIMEHMVRIIVVPTSIDLIEKVRRRRINHVVKGTSKGSDVSIHNIPATATVTKTQQVTSNPYILPKVPAPYIQTLQSLESVVDSVISSLVRNGKRVGTSLKMKSKHGTCPIKYRNVLCEGHRLGNDGFIHHSGTVQGTLPIAHSQTLGHGIQVTHPNACASFARSNPIMRQIHSLMGDDLLRELLLSSILFIPIGDNGMNRSSSLDNGNYFQLCGPPLDAISKCISPEDLSTRRTVGTKRKRNEDDTQSNETLFCGENHKNPIPYEQTLLIESDWVIPRYRMLYNDSFVKAVGLPPRHVLNQKTDNQSFLLLQRMLPLKALDEGTKGVRKRWKIIQTEALGLCSKIIQNHMKCDYHRLLDQSCPLPCTFGMSLEQIVSFSSSKESVASFLVRVVKRVFPSECWGSGANFEVIVKILRLFIYLRRKEDMSMKQLMKGIKITEIKWLNPGRGKHNIDHTMSTAIMQHFLRWLYNEFFMPLIRCTFYATDTQFTGDEVNYYRKPVWSKIRSLSIDQLTKEQFAKSDHSNNDLLGHSQLRILPKEKSIRPIALLCRKTAHASIPSSLQNMQKKSVNRELKQCFDVLTNEYKHYPNLYGFGVAGVSDLHERLIPFVMALKKSSYKDLFFVSLDILKCFDNINQEHLLNLIDKIMHRDEYLIQEHTILRSNYDKKGVLYDKQKRVGAPSDAMNAIMTANKTLENKKGGILIEHSECSIATKIQLFELITQHVKNNTLVIKEKFGPLFLHQTKGIPQGSVLSTMFCNIYYGDFEKTCMEDNEDVHLIVRVVDDFMLVTTDCEKATYFKQLLERGDSTLGVMINKSKTKTSHRIHHGQIARNDASLISIRGNYYFSWCGYLFNILTMEVHIDYSRFEGKAAIQSLRRFEKSKTEGTKFISRLHTFLAPRCQPILFDPCINSWEVLCINFYQTVAFAAVKCVLYLQSGGLEDGIDKNIDFIANKIEESIENAFDIISRRLNHAQEKVSSPKMNNNDSPKIKWLERSDAIWIGFLALLDIFMEHSNHDGLTSLLRRKQQCTRMTNIGILQVGVTAREMFNSSRFDFSTS